MTQTTTEVYGNHFPKRFNAFSLDLIDKIIEEETPFEDKWEFSFLDQLLALFEPKENKKDVIYVVKNENHKE